MNSANEIMIKVERLKTILESYATGLPQPFAGDLFKHQFPAGLPFGLKKPSLAFVPEKDSQKAIFENGPKINVIRENVYPNLTFEQLKQMLPGALPAILCGTQTPKEKEFLDSYRSRYDMLTANVPILIPQAWIQWHSEPKANLRSQSSSYVDDLYRVDFVAFWKDKRFAILIDDISHYAKKTNGRWDADEEAYSRRLKEDRKLRTQNWQVFRVSNWELRNQEYISKILTDLKDFMEF